MARRLVERGVRFVQIYSGGMENERSWDGHIDIAGNHRQFAGETDIPIGGSVDGPEAARPARFDAGDLGRRVRPAAGGAADQGHQADGPRPQPARLHDLVRRRRRQGRRRTTARPTRSATRRRSIASTVNDLHATILHLLGLDHTKLTYKYNGRNFRLTDVAGEVVKKIIA